MEDWIKFKECVGFIKQFEKKYGCYGLIPFDAVERAKKYVVESIVNRILTKHGITNVEVKIDVDDVDEKVIEDKLRDVIENADDIALKQIVKKLKGFVEVKGRKITTKLHFIEHYYEWGTAYQPDWFSSEIVIALDMLISIALRYAKPRNVETTWISNIVYNLITLPTTLTNNDERVEKIKIFKNGRMEIYFWKEAYAYKIKHIIESKGDV